jgi:hypothetical protein
MTVKKRGSCLGCKFHWQDRDLMDKVGGFMGFGAKLVPSKDSLEFAFCEKFSKDTYLSIAEHHCGVDRKYYERK